ncbi:MAG: hypothetical protein HY881_06665 [Deltaproteobacteria bacterium]|nr:hypothetical protein [Deltaproteobacteria bacterium]
MTRLEPTPQLSGENLLLDDDDVILLTDEILPAEDDDIIELSEIIDLFDTQETIKIPDPAKDKTDFFDLSDVLEETDLKAERLSDFSEIDTETLNLDFDQIPDSPLLELEPEMPVEDTVPLDVLHGNNSGKIKELAADKGSNTDNDLILLQDVAPLTLENEFVESLSLTIEPAQTSTLSPSGEIKAPDSEYQMEDLQQLIAEVVHDSQVPHLDFPGIHSESNEPAEKDAALNKDILASQSRDQIDAAMERVIRNLFTERIGHILDEVVTTTVTREIENLKTILLDYLTSARSADKIKS